MAVLAMANLAKALQPAGVLWGHRSSVGAVAFAPDGKTYAVASEMFVWLYPAGREPALRLQAHADSVRALVFSPDGRTLASAAADATVRLWRTADGKLERTLEHQAEVWSVAFSPDGQRLYTAGAEGVVRVWNPQGQELQRLGQTKAWLFAVAASPKGQFAAGGLDGLARVWGPGATERVHDARSGVFSLAFHPKTGALVVGQRNGGIRSWDASGQYVRGWEAHQFAVSALAYSPDGQRLLSGGQDGQVVLWQENQALRRIDIGHPVLALAAASQTLLVGDDSGYAQFFDLATGKRLRVIEPPAAAVSSLAYSPNGQMLASGGADKTIRLWQSGKLVRTLVGHTLEVEALRFSPDGQTLASGSRDGEVRVWRISDGQLLRRLGQHENGVSGLAFRGEVLVTAGRDEVLKFWNWKTGQLIRDFRAHQDDIDALAFSPDGRWLATAGADRKIRIWSPQGQLLRTFPEDPVNPLSPPEPIQPGAIYDLAWSPDSKTLATSSHDNAVRLWNPQTGALLRSLQGHTNAVTAVAFSPDGRNLVSASWDKSLRVWRLTDGALLQSIGGFLRPLQALAYSKNGVLATSSGSETLGGSISLFD